MKIHFNAFLRTVALASSLTYAAPCAVHAATGTWSGAFDGTWDTSDVNWSAVSGTPWDVTNGPDNTATFNTASLAVTVSGPIYTNGITFSTTGVLSGGNIDLVGVSPTISVTTGQTGTISSIAGGSTGLVKADAGLLTLSGANTYTGGTTVDGGRLTLLNNKTGSSNFVIHAELEIQNTLTGPENALKLSGGSITGTGSLLLSGGGELWLGGPGSPQLVSLSGVNSVIDMQNGLIRNEWGNTGWTDNKAGLNIGTNGRFEVHDSANTIVDELTGTGSLTKNNIGNNSNLIIGINNGSGTFSGTIQNFTGNLFIIKEGSGTQTLSGSSIQASGKTTINGGTFVRQNLSTPELQIDNANFTTHATLEFNVASGVETWIRTGTIDGTGNVVKTGAGRLSLSRYGSGGVQYVSLTGVDSIFDVQEGTVRNDWGNPNGWDGNLAGLRVASGAIFDVWDGATMTADELIGAGSITKTQGGGTVFTIGVNHGSGVFPGTITNPNGTISLVKQGTGTQTLSGVNTYSGTTTVNAGKLLVEGSIANTAVTVSNSGTVLASDAAASIGTSLTINSGAILAPGDAAAAGTITVGGSSTFNDSSIFSWDINATGAAYDRIVTSGVVDGGSAGGAVFRIVASDNTFAHVFWTANQTWNDIFTSDGAVAISDWATAFGSTVSLVDGNFNTITPAAGAFTLSGNTLTWSAVPEPTSALAGLLIGAGLLSRRRNRCTREVDGFHSVI